MHLSPLAGIETSTNNNTLTIIKMHLSPLAGIETDGMETVYVNIDLMHLSPLAGIETNSSKHIKHINPDASFTPCGD